MEKFLEMINVKHHEYCVCVVHNSGVKMKCREMGLIKAKSVNFKSRDSHGRRDLSQIHQIKFML